MKPSYPTIKESIETAMFPFVFSNRHHGEVRLRASLAVAQKLIEI